MVTVLLAENRLITGSMFCGVIVPVPAVKTISNVFGVLPKVLM